MGYGSNHISLEGRILLFDAGSDVMLAQGTVYFDPFNLYTFFDLGYEGWPETELVSLQLGSGKSKSLHFLYTTWR